MSNLARQYQTKVEPTKQASVQPKPQPQQEKRLRITLGEKILVGICAAIICFFSVQLVTTQSSVYHVNREIQDIETKIQAQQKENRDLEIQVSELSTYDRILKKAKELGLNLKEQNIKVVDQQ